MYARQRLAMGRCTDPWQGYFDWNADQHKRAELLELARAGADVHHGAEMKSEVADIEDPPMRRPRARSVGREGYLDQAFDWHRAASGVEHVYQSAERDRH